MKVKIIERNPRKSRSETNLKKCIVKSDSEDNVSLHVESDCEGLVLLVNDLVLSQFARKKKVVIYVGHIEEVEEKKMNYKVKLMRKREDTWTFYFSGKKEISAIERNDKN